MIVLYKLSHFISFNWIFKSTGDRIVPWGTPHFIVILAITGTADRSENLELLVLKLSTSISFYISMTLRAIIYMHVYFVYYYFLFCIWTA